MYREIIQNLYGKWREAAEWVREEFGLVPYGQFKELEKGMEEEQNLLKGAISESEKGREALISQMESIERLLKKSNDRIREQDEEIKRYKTGKVEAERIIVLERMLNESEELAQSYCNDLNEFKKNHTHFLSMGGNSLDIPTQELGVLYRFIKDNVLPPTSEIEPKDKLKVSTKAHKHPKGTEKFEDKVINHDYVNRLIFYGTTYKYKRPMLKVNDDKIIGVYVSNFGIRFAIKTTAKNEYQLKYIFRVLKNYLHI